MLFSCSMIKLYTHIVAQIIRERNMPTKMRSLGKKSSLDEETWEMINV